MPIASSTVRRESWRVCVVRPSGVEQSSFSTEFDPTLKSPGNWEISGLCPLQLGGQLGPSWLPTSRHSLTASSNCGIPLQITVRPVSCLPVLVRGLHPSLVLRVSSSLRLVRSSESVSTDAARYGRTAGAGIASSAGL